MTATVWHPQSTLFRVLAEHLGFFPDLPPVAVHRGLPGVDAELKIDARPTRGETTVDAPAVLMWANTMTEPTLCIHQHGDSAQRTTMQVTGGIDELTVTVWDVDEGELYRLLDPAQRETEITVDQLAQYVETGVVETQLLASTTTSGKDISQ